jgi:exosortase/archaeosortase family protein
MPADRRPVLLAATALACWPVWGWYLQRLGDSGDDAVALVALAALLVLSARRPAPPPTGLAPWLPSVIALVGYAITFPFVPRLVSAVLAFLAVGFTWSLWRHGTPARPWVVGLGLLGLPMAASLQFYAGYPLRVASGVIALVMLRLSGFAVEREGVYLRWGQELVMIDAPCSGLRMLWTALLLGCCLAGLLQLAPRASLLVLSAAAALAVLANGLRAAALFWADASGPVLPASAHQAIGASVFLLMALALLALARSLRERVACA